MPIFERGSGVNPVRPEVQPQHPKPDTQLPQTDYQKFYGRMVRTLKKVIGMFSYIATDKPTSAQTFHVYETFTKGQQFHDGYHKALHDYKVASAMELHKLASIDERQIDGHSEIVIGSGSKASSTEAVKKLAETLKLSPTNLCYSFLAKGKSLPPGYLKRALLPHFEEELMRNYGLSMAQSSQTIQTLSAQVGLRYTSDITFERVLELKNAIRWKISPHEVALQTDPSKPQTFDPRTPALTPPALATPGVSRYQLDDEDKEYIQKAVDSGGSLKIPKHDLMNRLKRMVLRNKSNIFLNTMGIIVSTALTAAATGGLSAGLNILIYLGWFAGWSGGTEAIRMAKVMRAMKKMEKTKDFALNPTDMEAFRGFDEEKFKTFMKNCRYVCSHDTLAQIYNCYAELEKDVEKSERLSKGAINTVDDAVRFEESKARYRYRKNNLDMSFDLFNRLYTGAVGDLQRMEEEWNRDIEALWQHKFKGMDAKKRARLFKKAAHDHRVAVKKYRFQTDKTDWLKEIFPKMASDKEWTEIERDQALERAERELRESSGPKVFKEKDKKRLNKYADHVLNATNIIKSGIRSFIMSKSKSALQTTVNHGFKVGWHGIRNAPYLEITPQLPKISIDGLMIFGFFFVADLFLGEMNSGVNNYRLKQIKKGKKGKTGITMRERTGREEIATLRKLSKEKMVSFVDTLMTLHDAHKSIMGEMDYHKHLNRVDPLSPPFSHMDEYEAAVLILRRKYYEQVMARMTTGAIGQFHHQVQKKSAALDSRMVDVMY